MIDWIEWEGPITKPADLAKRMQFYPKSEDRPAARQNLAEFAEAAWHRPASDAEVSRYAKLMEDELDAGENFRAAYKLGMLGVMASRNFFYLVGGDAGQKRDRIHDWELASRLSYFLWSSLPDEELLTAAQAGNLHLPAILRKQVRRMLGDEKAARFKSSFPRQSLQLDRLGMFPPDSRLYPEYDLWLQQSMFSETVAFFGEVYDRNAKRGRVFAFGLDHAQPAARPSLRLSAAPVRPKIEQHDLAAILAQLERIAVLIHPLDVGGDFSDRQVARLWSSAPTFSPTVPPMRILTSPYCSAACWNSASIRDSSFSSPSSRISRR